MATQPNRVARSQSLRVAVDEAELRVLHLRADEPRSSGKPVVFVPGWASTLSTWSVVLDELATRDVYYLESREKASSRILSRSRSTPQSYARDLMGAVEALGLADHEFHLIGGSTGSNTILLAVNQGLLKPASICISGPHIKIPLPRWSRAFDYMPLSLLRLARSIFLFLLDHGVVPRIARAQAHGLRAAVLESDLGKIRDSAACWRGYHLGTLNRDYFSSTLVVGSLQDHMHPVEAAREIAALLDAPIIEFVDASRESGTHSANFSKIVNAWLDSIEHGREFEC
jgi:pimeloyl-ACP methyl ester carboxylesterase